MLPYRRRDISSRFPTPAAKKDSERGAARVSSSSMRTLKIERKQSEVRRPDLPARQMSEAIEAGEVELWTTPGVAEAMATSSHPAELSPSHFVDIAARVGAIGSDCVDVFPSATTVQQVIRS